MVVLLGKKCLWVLVATSCTLGSGVAWAEPFHEDPPDEVTSTVPSSERWYGWQTLSVDVIPAGLFVGALATDGEPTLWLTGSATFAVGGPIVHILHERPLIGLASFGLRAGLPVLGVAIGMAFTDMNPSPDMPGVAQDDPNDGIKPYIIGGLAGTAAASLLDAALLAYEISPEPARKSEALGASNLGVSFRVAPGGGRITVLGAF